MTKFITRTLLAALPVFLMVALYAFRDPFHVVHPVITSTENNDSVVAGCNAGFTAVETYLAHDNERHFNSFIFGSSMSQNYKAGYWLPYLDKDASILHFDASGETLDGIINKMHFLNSHGSTIKNALIIIEVEMLDRPIHDDDILYAQHPSTTQPQDWLKFHTLYFNAFRNLTQVKSALFPQRYHNEMVNKGMISDEKSMRIGDINEVFYAISDSLIANAPSKFFTKQRLLSRKHSQLPAPALPVISQEIEAKLRMIKSIIDQNKTDFIILVPPCNVKPQLKWADLWVLKNVFGEDKVFDFSSHPGLVYNEYVYYDQPGHLISAKCKEILDSAYHEKSRISGISNPFFGIYNTKK